MDDVLTIHDEPEVPKGQRGSLTMATSRGTRQETRGSRGQSLAARTESELDSRFGRSKPAVKPSLTAQLTSWATPSEPVTLQSCAKQVVATGRSLCPLAGWLGSYQRNSLGPDLSAGLTVGIMLIPQAVAYGLLAELPLQYGLYAAIVPCIVYACLGTSRETHVGPMALVALLVSSSVNAIMNSGDVDLELLSEEELMDIRVETTMALTLMVGVVLLCFAILQLGFLVSFMAQPVIQGFTCGAAVLITWSQLKHVFGISISGRSFIDITSGLWEEIGDTHGGTLLIGILCIVVLHVCRFVNKKYELKFPIPSELMIIVVVTLIVGLGGLDADDDTPGVRVLGEIPSGLPPPVLPDFDAAGASFDAFVVEALLVAVIAYIISASISKGFGIKNKYEVSMNQELVALGMAGVIGSIFGAYVPSGSLSRSSVAEGIGAHTQLFAIVSVLITAFVLLFLVDLLFYLPYVVLASIILVSLTGLMAQVTRLPRLWKLFRDDFWMFLITFLATVFLGTTYGIVVGIGWSFVVIFKQTARPHYCELGRLPGTNLYRSIERFPSAQQIDNILIFQFASSLTFANKDYFLDALHSLLADRKPETCNVQTVPKQHEAPLKEDNKQQQQSPKEDVSLDAESAASTMSLTMEKKTKKGLSFKTKQAEEDECRSCEQIRAEANFVVILDCSSIVKFDSTAFEMLCDIVRENEVELFFASARGSLWDLIGRAGKLSECQLLSDIRVFVGVDKAVVHAEQILKQRAAAGNQKKGSSMSTSHEDAGSEEEEGVVDANHKGSQDAAETNTRRSQIRGLNHHEEEDKRLPARGSEEEEEEEGEANEEEVVVDIADDDVDAKQTTVRRKRKQERMSSLLSVDSPLDYKHFLPQVEKFFEEVTAEETPKPQSRKRHYDRDGNSV